MDNKKKRSPYLLGFLAVLFIEILIALFVRDRFIRPYGGDVLVTVLLCLLARLVFLKRVKWIPLWVFLFSVAVEIGQYFDLVTLLCLENNRFFSILLGTTFSWADLVCYGVGCILFTATEWAVLKVYERKRTKQENEKENHMTDYEGLHKDLAALIEGDLHPLSSFANTAALLNERMTGLNWVGFYFLTKAVPDRLILGPFQGKTACTEIPVGKGVCGTAVKENRTILVKDVHQFEGHIACDSASRSEIVLPIRRRGMVVAVLDIDSPHLARFDEMDREGLESVVAVLERVIFGKEDAFEPDVRDAFLL